MKEKNTARFWTRVLCWILAALMVISALSLIITYLR